jgi:DNA-binding transcriptional ArsR family regulator
MSAVPARRGVPAIAAAIGEPARARMLLSLMDGRARTSTELAIIAQVSAPTASVHLAKLRAVKLVRTLPAGRNRYYSLQGEEVATALEALSVLAGAARDASAARIPAHLRVARTCYDHVAGALGVSWHDRLRAVKLVRTLPAGRNRYYSLQGEEVATALEALSVLAGAAHDASAARIPAHLRVARTCYDHVAGALGVSWHDRLRALEWLALDERAGSYQLTARGASGLADLGVDVGAVRAQRRRFACACLDWSERRAHLAGALGAALLQLALKHRWVQRHLDSRALSITRIGRRELAARFGLEA